MFKADAPGTEEFFIKRAQNERVLELRSPEEKEVEVCAPVL